MASWALSAAIVLLMIASGMGLLDTFLCGYVLAIAFWLLVSGLSDFTLKKIVSKITKRKGRQYWTSDNSGASLSFAVLSFLRMYAITYGITLIPILQESNYLYFFTLAICFVDCIINLYMWLVCDKKGKDSFIDIIDFGYTVGSWIFILYYIKKFHHFIFCFVAFLLLLPATAAAYPATVTHITDGDTLDVLAYGDADTPVTLRLYGIDAPEKDQPGGQESAAYLSEMLPEGSDIEVLERHVDKYGRAVALVYANGKCINAAMLRAGHAWYAPRYCHGRLCVLWERIQRDAAATRAGLWREAAPTPPWTWRKK